MVRWTYGNAWEKHPVQLGETWVERNTGSRLAVGDLTQGIPDWMREADMVYCDPPWTDKVLRDFCAQAGTEVYGLRFLLLDLARRIHEIDPRVCYIEMGKTNICGGGSLVDSLFPIVQSWRIRYGKGSQAWLFRGGQSGTPADFSDHDEARTPAEAIALERPSCVADLCMGKGLTAVAAYQAGVRFVGIELNPRKLAAAIQRIETLGGRWERE